ncbi:MAG: mucoidy inhibitor MuiA family protein, partial [Planctomycetota bacterium]
MYQHTLQTLFIATSLAALTGAPHSMAQSTVAIDPDVAMQNASDNGTIRAVTLYPGRAAVTRSVQRELKQGLWSLRISNLPAAVQAGSLQAKVNAAAGTTTKSAPKLLAVEYSQTPRVAFSSSPEGIALAENVQTLSRKIEFLKQDRALLAQHDKLIDQIGIRATASASADGATQAVDLAAVAKQLEFVHTEKERILGVAREQNQRNEVLTRELQVATEQLETLGGADRTERSALVLMAIPESCTVDVELTYLVGNATWEPAYAVRAAGDRTGVTVEYDALVSQRTGEDWKDVKLALSTAQPTRASSPPAVEPWYVDVFVPPPAVTGAPAPRAVFDSAPSAPMAMAMARPMEKSDSAVRKELEELSAAATVQETGTAVSFEIPRPVTIPTDASKKQRTRISSF